MDPSDTTAVNPRDDGTRKAGKQDQDTTNRPYHVPEPKAAPDASPGPDTREEPDSPK